MCMLIFIILSMDDCWICDRKMLQHACNITYSVCFKSYQLKCISIDPVVAEYIEQNRRPWYCSHCLTNVFPFIKDSPLHGSLIYLSELLQII